MVSILNFRLRKGPRFAKLQYFEKQVGFEGVPFFCAAPRVRFWGLGLGIRVRGVL